MARVVFLAAQRRFTGGVRELELPATDFRGLIAAVRARFPAFPEKELAACSVAIDGEIVNRPWLEPIGPASEVVFVARLAAG
jgi:hypothetical protein